MHRGRHDSPSLMTVAQSPGAALAIALISTGHDLGTHDDVAIITPLSHIVGLDRTYPSLHVGLHSLPCSSDSVQSPLDPLTGMVTTHDFGSQTDADKTPLVHVVWFLRVYPSSHVGLHVHPLDRVTAQSPGAPWSGIATRQESGTHNDGVTLPAWHVVGAWRVNPTLH